MGLASRMYWTTLLVFVNFSMSAQVITLVGGRMKKYLNFLKKLGSLQFTDRVLVNHPVLFFVTQACLIIHILRCRFTRRLSNKDPVFRECYNINYGN